MIKHHFYILYFVFCLNGIFKARADVAASREEIDSIKVICHGPQDTSIFCFSDFKRPGIDNRAQSSTDLCLLELVRQDVQAAGIPIDDDVVLPILHQQISSYGLKPGDENRIFAESGRTPEEGLNDFKKIYAQRVKVDQISSSVFISEDEVKHYDDMHPLFNEAELTFQKAQVFFDPVKHGSIEHLELVLKKLNQKNNTFQIEWSDPISLKESEIMEDLKFLTKQKVGSITLPRKSGQSFELFKLTSFKPKRRVPLKKRRAAIAAELQQPAFQDRLQKYNQKLLANAAIIHMD